MTNRRKNFFALVFAFLLVAAAAFYIYKDLSKTPSPSLTPAKSESQNPSISVGTTGNNQNYKVTILDLPTTTTKIASNSPKKPSFGLPATNYSHIDEAAFEIVAKNIGTLENELKTDPENELNWLNLAISRKMLGDYQVSVEILNYVAILWPKDHVPFNNLADLYQFYIKNYPLAEKNWLKVVVLKPDYPEAYENLYGLYTDPTSKDKQALALPILLQGFKNNPKSIGLMVYVARYYRSAGDNTNAAFYYAKAVDEAKAENNQALETSIRSELAEISK